jgi:hypothetical protein
MLLSPPLIRLRTLPGNCQSCQLTEKQYEFFVQKQTRQLSTNFAAPDFVFVRDFEGGVLLAGVALEWFEEMEPNTLLWRGGLLW